MDDQTGEKVGKKNVSKAFFGIGSLNLYLNEQFCFLYSPRVISQLAKSSFYKRVCRVKSIRDCEMFFLLHLKHSVARS